MNCAAYRPAVSGHTTDISGHTTDNPFAKNTQENFMANIILENALVFQIPQTTHQCIF